MASYPSTLTKPALLSLPDDALGRIFNHLTVTNKYTLQSSIDAINLASTNTRLHRIFSAQLTHITPLVHNERACTLSPQRYEALIRIAGENLRELHISECHHSYLYDLPNLCPNLEALYVVERFHTSDEHLSDDTDDDEDGGNGADDQHAEENDLGDEDAGDEEVGVDDVGDDDVGDDGQIDPQASGSEERNGETSENSVSDNDASEYNIIDNDAIDIDDPDNDPDNDANDEDPASKSSGGGEDTHQGPEEDQGNAGNTNNQDDGNHTAVVRAMDTGDLRHSSCPIPHIFPRLNLRKLTVVRLPEKLTPSIMNKMADNSLQELHLHRMRKHQLPMLIPLLSHPLKSLTVTTNFYDGAYSERVSKFVDALAIAVLRIPSVIVHFPEFNGLNTYRESASNIFSLDFPDEAASLIASARRNSCESDCINIDLSGDKTYRILSGVNRNANISLTNDKITVCDRGEGLYVTSLPLYDEFLDMDLTHLEKAYIVQRSCMEEEDFFEHGWDPEWGIRLAGHRLNLVRCCDANALNRLQLSTKALEFFCFAILNITDWSCLTGVEEVYLLGPPMDCEDQRFMTIEAVLEALPPLIDAFRGGFIAIGMWGRPDFRGCSDPQMALQHAYKTKDAIDRFVRRGGDAATLSAYIDAVADNLKVCLEGS